MKIPNPQRVGRRSWLVALAVLAGLGPAAAEPVGPTRLVLAGAVMKPQELSVADLRAFPESSLTTLNTTRRVGGKDVSSTLRGVRLTALLERAGLDEHDRHDWKHAYVLATAVDRYRVLLSWPELFNSEAGSQVLVVFERDGKPLDDAEGPLALFSARDTKTGPRHVKWLARLDVRIVNE